MKRPKKLTRQHKIKLDREGYNPKDYLIECEDKESYKFINKITCEPLFIRR